MLTPAPLRLRARPALPLVVLLATGCAVFSRSESTLPEHMEGHRAQVAALQTALIHGDLEATRAPALWLAEHPEHPQVPQGVLSPLEDMRAFARGALRAESLADAARSTAELTASCGRCHQAAGGGLKLERTSMPPSGSGSGPHMARHLWATNRMADGIVGPSAQSWQLGATALAEDPLFLATGDTGNREVATLARQVHSLGATARSQRPEKGAGVYASLMVTCARCHTLLGVAGAPR